MYTLRFDGLLRSLSDEKDVGFLCYGWLILRDGVVIATGHGAYGRCKGATSNVAEYLALIDGLEALTDLGVCDAPIEVSGDARCVIDQMLGIARVRAINTLPLHRKATRLAQQFPRLWWVWTPRRKNKAADALTRRAMRQMDYDPEQYQAAVRALIDANKRPSTRLVPLLGLRVYGGARQN
jgi:ribonuclease HI